MSHGVSWLLNLTHEFWPEIAEVFGEDGKLEPTRGSVYVLVIDHPNCPYTVSSRRT